MMPTRQLLVLAATIALAACSDDSPPREVARPLEQDAEAAPQTSAEDIVVVFTRDEQPVSVARRALPADADLEGALAALVRGPSAEERAAGIQSWFSATTSGALQSVTVDGEGHAVVDFADLRELIPNAGSSAGSSMLLHELNGTVFQFPAIRSVEYRIGGSCAAFWEWLQYDCQVVQRPAS